MENFIIESKNKKLQVNGIEIDLLFDENEFCSKLFDLQNNISKSNSKNPFKETEKIAHDLDEIFGTDFCKRIFGTSTPSSVLLAKLIGFITPYVESFSNDHIKESEEKYNPEREGNV